MSSSAPRRDIARCFCSAWVVAQTAGFQTVWAQDSDGSTSAGSVVAVASEVRVLLLVSEETEWSSRAHNQLSDVTGSVSDVSMSPSTGIDVQLEAVRRAGHEQRADIVAWMAPDLKIEGEGPGPSPKAGTYVLIWMAASDTYDARRLGQPWHQLTLEERSAALETGAMSVRSAVRALQLDRANAETNGTLAATPTGVVEPAPARLTQSQDTILPDPAGSDSGAALPESPSAVAWGWHAGAGFEWQLDGQTNAGMWAMKATAGLRREDWSGSVVGTVGLATSIQTPGAELELVRRALALEAARSLVATSRLSLTGALQGGVVWSRRETHPKSSDVLALEPREQVAPTFAAGLRGGFQLSERQVLTLEVTAGWHPFTPTYVIEDAARAQRLEYAPWKVQPCIGIGWLLVN